MMTILLSIVMTGKYCDENNVGKYCDVDNDTYCDDNNFSKYCDDANIYQ